MVTNVQSLLKVVKKVAKPNVAKVIKCGLNPDTGRCKIGMKHVGRCELRLAKDGTKNCTKKKLVLKKQKAPKKKIIIKKTAIKKNIKDNSVPHGKYKLTLKEAKDCGVNPVSGRCKFGTKEMVSVKLFKLVCGKTSKWRCVRFLVK